MDRCDGEKMQLKEIYKHLDIENKAVKQKARNTIKYLFNKYEFLGIGLYRVVFKVNDDLVFKFPLSAAGEYCNDGEGSWFCDYYAKSRWLKVNDFICVMQEYVEPASYEEVKNKLGEYPDWVSSIDCGQVGFTKDGILKAYDYVHP